MKARAILIGLGGLALFVGGCWLLYALRSVVLLVVLAVFFAYLIAPLVDFTLDRLNRPGTTRVATRPVAIAMVYVSLMTGFALVSALLVPAISAQVGELVDDAPNELARVGRAVDSVKRTYGGFHIPAVFKKAIDEAAAGAMEMTSSSVLAFFEAFTLVLRFLPWLVLIPIVAVFLLKDAQLFRTRALAVLPHGRMRWRGADFFDDVNRTLANYVRAQLLGCFLIGTVCTGVFMAFGVPYALVLGVAAGILEFIPMVGPLVIGLVAVISAGSVSIERGFFVFCVLLTIRIAYDYFLYPRLVGGGMKLHPLAIILGILSGAELGGIVGIFLAVPVIAIFAITYRYLSQNSHLSRYWNELFSNVEPEPLVAVNPLPRGGDYGIVRKSPVSGLRVVIVDDDQAARELLTAALEQLGGAVSSAATATEGLKLIRELRPDVIVSDLDMPEKDGFDFIRILRESADHTPAAALSGYGRDEDRERSLAAGFQAHLLKPIEPSVLAEALGALARAAAEPREPL